MTRLRPTSARQANDERMTKPEVRRCASETFRACLGRSADFQSAVSPICNRQRVQWIQRAPAFGLSAECNSAIQQIENLRYFFAARRSTRKSEMRPSVELP